MTKSLTKSERVFKAGYIAFLCICFALLIFGVVYSFKPAKAEAVPPAGGIPIDYPVIMLTPPLIESYEYQDGTLTFVSKESGEERPGNFVNGIFIFDQPVGGLTVKYGNTVFDSVLNATGTVGRTNSLAPIASLDGLTWTVTTSQNVAPVFFCLYAQNYVYLYMPFFNYETPSAVLPAMFEQINNSLNSEYIKGFNNGYEDGVNVVVENTDAYIKGYDVGYADGERQGYQTGYIVGEEDGYQSGYTDGQQSEVRFGSEIAAIATAPIKMIHEMLNFDILGTNLSGLVMGVLSALLVIKVVTFFV